jgi:hypothetical protein
MLNFYRPFFMSCFGRHFENGRHLEKEKLAKKKIRLQVLLIDFRHRKISTGLHFQNERHNAAKIQVQNLSQCKVFI